MKKIEREYCHYCETALSPGRCYFDNTDAKRVAFEALGERNFEDWGHTGFCCKSCYESGKEEFERKMSMMNRKEKIEKLYASSVPGLYNKFIDILENLEYEQKPWEAGNLWITRSKIIHLKQYPFDYKDFTDMKTAVCYCRNGKWNVESKGFPDKIYSSPQELLLDWTID